MARRLLVPVTVLFLVLMQFMPREDEAMRAMTIILLGTMSITITQGKHFYDLDYTLEPARNLA